MGDEEGVEHVSSVQHALLNQRVEGDGFFEAGGSDVLAVLQLELGLHTAGDGKVAIGQLAKVTGTEGAGFNDDFLGGFLVVPVAHHDVGAGDHDFTLVGALGVVPGVRVDGDLHAVGNLANGVEFARTGAGPAIGGHQRRGFGQAVAFVAVEADHLDEGGHVGGQRSGTGHAEADVAAKPGTDLGPHKLVPQLVKEAVGRHGVALHTGLGDALGGGLLSVLDEDLLQAGSGLELRIDTVVELVPDTRHGQQHRWLDLDALVGDLGQVRNQVDVHATANHPVQVKGGPEGVCPGQERSVLVAHVDGEGGLHAENVRERVPVGEHDTLGVARGTGGVDQRVECKRVVGDLEHVGLAASGHEVGPCVNSHAFRWEFVGGFIAQQEDAARGPSAGVARHVGHELVEHGGVSHSEERRRRIVEDVGPFRAVLVRVHGGVGGTDTVGTVGEGGPFHGVVEDEGHTVAGLHANSSELLAHSGGEVAKFVVGQVRSGHAWSRDVAEARQVAEAAHAGHQHLVQSSGVVALGLLPLSVVGLAFPCKFKGFHGYPVSD